MKKKQRVSAFSHILWIYMKDNGDAKYILWGGAKMFSDTYQWLNIWKLNLANGSRKEISITLYITQSSLRTRCIHKLIFNTSVHDQSPSLNIETSLLKHRC